MKDAQLTSILNKLGERRSMETPNGIVKYAPTVLASLIAAGIIGLVVMVFELGDAQTAQLTEIRVMQNQILTLDQSVKESSSSYVQKLEFYAFKESVKRRIANLETLAVKTN
jgi:uncharacterized membrane protein YraQ (UPF0718 family)